ncbi:ATP-binding protein [Vibrio genomosp. F10]|nr:ATP-binding protein [Vibrio genomosp. F10]
MSNSSNHTDKTSSARVSSRVLIQRYRSMIYGGLLLIIGLTLGNALYLSQQIKQQILNEENHQGVQTLQALSQTISVSLDHIDHMRYSVETAREHPDLMPSQASLTYLEQQANKSPDAAPWDSLPAELKKVVGQVFVASDAGDISFDKRTLLTMMPTVVATHQQHKEFQWTYYYDAHKKLSQLFPGVSFKDLLAATGTANMDEALNVIYEAGGTFPLQLVSPDKNLERNKVWTPPYMDAGGKGMMISLLAPVYQADTFIGAVGTDITLKVLDTILNGHPSKIGRFVVLDATGTVVADSQGALKDKTDAVSQREVLSLVNIGEAHQIPAEQIQNVDGGYWISYSLEHTPWNLVLEIPDANINGYILKAILPYLIMGMLFAALLLFVVLYQHWNFSQPALRLAQFVEEIPETKDISIPNIPSRWRHWFESVARTETDRRLHLSTIEQQTQLLEQRVNERTIELQEALKTLKSTQDELIHSEKLAGLGSLVAGIAHELNTPIGNALLVASSIKDFNNDFIESTKEGLRKSVLDQYLSQSAESASSIEHNLRRAAELITSFKQVAIDQTSDQRRKFNLAEILHELRITMTPTLSREQIQLEEQLSDSIVMDNYPGPLTQVMMNLLSNAITHAFDNQTTKLVTITCSLVDEHFAMIELIDNGQGIEPEHLPKIFDPFFTTRLGAGGSGLGLNISYNIVTGLLGGELTVTSVKGEGTKFTLRIPLIAPPESK